MKKEKSDAVSDTTKTTGVTEAGKKRKKII
jgi:hypothetical protein